MKKTSSKHRTPANAFSGAKKVKTVGGKEKRTGRPRSAFPVMDGMGQVAGKLKVPKSLLTEAKNNGCSEAFLTGSRVDTDVLVPFLFQMLLGERQIPAGFSSWKEWGEANRAKLDDLELQKKKGAIIETAVAETQAAEAMGEVFGRLSRYAQEWPPALAGLSAVEIGKRVSAEIEKLRRALTDKFNQVGKL